MTAVPLVPVHRSNTDGLAPRGMLWVAWRQRRSLIAITLALYAATVTVIVVRSLVRARELRGVAVADLLSCRDPAMPTAVLTTCERWLATADSWSALDSQLSGARTLICVLFGLGLGAAAVGHEFERNLGAFSFTQSVSRIRWAATQLLVVSTFSVTSIIVFDVVTRALVNERNPVATSASGLLADNLWMRPLLLVAMVSIAFALSIVSRSSAGGFWGGLGFLVMLGFAMNFINRSSVPTLSVGLTCQGDADVCSRAIEAAYRFRALAADTSDPASAPWAITLALVGATALVTGFLVLRKRSG